ncbi:MAG: YjbQ family protein [Candidatus Melainabacteria bacterium]|nr:YjbQ family protein [Candidatus Melainabacteria bacterium]
MPTNTIHTKTIQIKTKGFTDIVDLSDEIENFLQETKIKEGTLVVFVPGSTAAITTVEYEPRLKKDISGFLEKILPYKKNYEHHKTWGDNNGSAHIRAALVGPSQAIPIINGKLTCGTWQQVVLIDFDTGARARKVILQII